MSEAGADVVVVGAGIIGLSIARQLTMDGADVMVVDRDLPASGTSSRGEGNLLLSDKTHPVEAALAVRSLALWKEWHSELAVDFEYEQKGGLIVARTERQLALLRGQANRQYVLGISSSTLTPRETREREPRLSREVAGSISYADDAQVQPTLAVRALLDWCVRNGVSVVPHAEVLSSTAGTTSVTLTTSSGSFEGSTIINATGPWSGELARKLGGSVPVFPRRGQLLVTEPIEPGFVHHKVYDGRYVEAVGSNSESTEVAPVIEGTRSHTVLIGSTRDRVGWDNRVRWDHVGRLAREAIALFPELSRVSIIRTYQGFRPATPDHLPIIGPDAAAPMVFHATGHEGAGIGLAPASAEVVSRGIATGRWLDELLPNRFDGGEVPDATPVVSPSMQVPGPPPPSRARRAAPAVEHLTNGALSWRRTRFENRPRGLFCGIGHCHDCIQPDQSGRTIRACLPRTDPR